jgi:Protein of unknown function (DUF1698)
MSEIEDYETAVPSKQTAVDVFRDGWVSRLPDGLDGGDVPLFDDDRIKWLAGKVSLRGLSVLELGPLEGGHSYMLEGFGAARVVAVEANRRAYLRCLIVKEVFSLRRVEFMCGDLVEYLRHTPETFDLCVASGILYHMRDPVETLRLASRITDRLFLWTHYYDAAVVRANQLVSAHFPSDSGPPFRYEYGDVRDTPSFCGGGDRFSYWLDRATILRVLGELGFAQVDLAFDHPGHPNGPAVAILAERGPALQSP